MPTLVTASAGNHGRALAWAAHHFSIPLTVFTPRSAPKAKLEPIAALGTDLRAEADDYEDAERRAKAWAAAGHGTFISPYSHRDVIAGAGTVALEILEELPGVAEIVVPVGGGGLLSGVALAVGTARRPVRVTGVEAESSPAFSESLKSGHITQVNVRPTIADGLAGNMDPDTIVFGLVEELVDSVVIAPEEAIIRSVVELARSEHLIVEGAGATAVAGIIAGKRKPAAGPVVAVVSGSNIDMDRLCSLLIKAQRCDSPAGPL
jgi:threonine dehydratase